LDLLYKIQSFFKVQVKYIKLKIKVMQFMLWVRFMN
jgi:hypothetical protein